MTSYTEDMKKTFDDIVNEASLIEVNVNQLRLNSLYSTRSSEAVLERKDKTARDVERRKLKEELLQVMELKQRYHQPIVIAIVGGERVVIDGWLRVEVARKHADKTGDTVLIDAKCLGVLTSVDAFRIAQQANQQHGIRIDAEQQRHIQLRQHILENRPIGTTRELAREYHATSSRTGAKLKKCLEWITPHQKDIQKMMNNNDVEGAMDYIKEVIQTNLGMYDEDDFKALGIPSAYKWAGAIELLEDDTAFEDVDEDKRLRLEALNALETAIRERDAEHVRWALKKLDRKALGITVKREYDAEAYTLKYELNGGDF